MKAEKPRILSENIKSLKKFQKLHTNNKKFKNHKTQHHSKATRNTCEGM